MTHGRCVVTGSPDERMKGTLDKVRDLAQVGRQGVRQGDGWFGRVDERFAFPGAVQG